MATEDAQAPVTLVVGDITLEFDGTMTAVMGVINVSPESRNRQTIASTPAEAVTWPRDMPTPAPT